MTNNDPRQRIRQLEMTCNKYVTEISRLEFKIGELNSELARLHAELKFQTSTRQHAHALYRKIDDAIIHQIDKRGFVHKKPIYRKMTWPIAPEDFATKSKAELLALAAQYDSTAYFRYHSPRTAMRLRYRLLSKAYRTLRDAGLLSLKKTYRHARRLTK